MWGERDGYWIYLRPKFRALYVSKVMGGKLAPEFDDEIETVEPQARPLDEWMTLRAEARGRRLEVHLDDVLCLSPPMAACSRSSAGPSASGTLT